jgi:RimJ/RimL family protein N-acetyltransferase
MSALDLIETERLVLSGWRRDQLDDLVRLHGDPEVSRYLGADGAPWPREKCAKRLEEWIGLFATQGLGKLRVRRKADYLLVGRAGFGIFGPTGEPEIGYAMFPEHQGLGYATEAAAALRDWIFRDTRWDHFIGFADTRTAPSLAVLKRIGMRVTHVVAFEGMPCQFHVLEKPA